jgi:predicted ATPase
VLGGLWQFYLMRAEYQTACELGELLLTLAQNMRDPVVFIMAHDALGQSFFCLGELDRAHAHLEQGILHYDPQHHRTLTFLCGGEDPGVACRGFASWDLWLRGYPDQALKRNHEALRLAQEVAHPFSLAHALNFTAGVHLFRGEKQAAQERVETLIRLSSEQGFLYFLGWGTFMRGWALAEQGQGEEGIVQIRQGMDACQTTGAEGMTSLYFTSLAKAYGEKAQVREGLTVIAEALALVDKIGERYCEAELYRLKGELLLTQEGKEASQKAKVKAQKSKIETDPRPLPPDHQGEAEACFLKAIEIAQKQQAKSLELRAVMSLARLRQQQAMQGESRNTNHESRIRLDEAHRILSEVYNWFTEGFDTKDLQEAKALLESLSL